MFRGSLRLKWRAALAVFVLVLATTRAEMDNEIENNPDSRNFLGNQNSTLIPLGGGSGMLVATVGIIAIVIGAIFLINIVFNPNGKHGGLFSPWLNQGYPGGSQQNPYYQQNQAQSYLYEPYSKSYQGTQPVSR